MAILYFCFYLPNRYIKSVSLSKPNVSSPSLELALPAANRKKRTTTAPHKEKQFRAAGISGSLDTARAAAAAEKYRGERVEW